MSSAGNNISRNREFWRSVYADYYQRALELARRRLPKEERDDAEDCVHDAFVRLLTYIPDATHIEDKTNYVAKVVQNVCSDRSVRRARLTADKTVSLDAPRIEENDEAIVEIEDPRRGPEMNTLVNEENENLLRQLEAHCRDLLEREKSLLRLHLQGVSNDQIASAWNEDVKIIRVEMNALLAKIRYRLSHPKDSPHRSLG